MWKAIGCIWMLGGMVGFLYNWICSQREKQKQLEEFILFLNKSIFAVEKEKVRVIDYFAKYKSQDYSNSNGGDDVLKRSLQEMAKRLSTNTYPNGQLVWEEVLKEEEQNWGVGREIFQILLQAGNGFFGRSKEENLNFLKKCLEELERQLKEMKERDAQERKVWVPVGLLSTVMIMILFI